MRKILLIITSLVLISLTASFYFLGTGKTLLLLIFAGTTVDKTLDRTFGPSKTTVAIDGQKFRIPEDYVVIATKAKGQYKDSVIFKLEFIFPSYTPKRLASRDEYKAAEAENRIGNFWITKAFPEKTEKALRLEPRGELIKTEPVGNHQGFEKYQHYFRQSRDSQEFTPSSTTYIIRDKDGKITDVADCTPKAQPPLCQYHFIDNGLLYTVRFPANNEDNLASWKQKTIEFIDQFRIQ